MKRQLATLILTLTVAAGCARFTSHQVKTLSDGTRIEQTQTVVTLFDGRSEIARLRASTTDATQGLTVGGINQDTTSTNVNAAVGEILGAALRAAVK